MAVFVLGLVLLLAMADHSDGAYCVCNSGVSDTALQKNIDYACGNGADCSPILQNGACYNPNTVKDHCNYAVNSYYQRKGQTTDSCNFQNTAAVTQNPPSTSSGCTYPSGPSGNTSPSSPGTGGSPNNGGTNTGGSTIPGSTLSPPGIGLAPTGTFTDNTGGSVRTLQQSSSCLVPLALIVLIYGFIWPRS